MVMTLDINGELVEEEGTALPIKLARFAAEAEEAGWRVHIDQEQQWDDGLAWVDAYPPQIDGPHRCLLYLSALAQRDEEGNWLYSSHAAVNLFDDDEDGDIETLVSEDFRLRIGRRALHSRYVLDAMIDNLIESI